MSWPHLIRHYLFARRNGRKNAKRAGIAIAPILFMIALLGIVAMVLAVGSGDFSTASVADRISATVASQADLIRTKINQCNIEYESAYSLCVSGQPCNVGQTSDPYPLSNTVSGTDVASLLCDPMGTQSLWADNTLLPQPTTGFNDWYYIDASGAGGGRCIWTEPNTGNPSGNDGIVSGLTKAANKFANGASFNASNDVIYNPSSTSQKFVLWITMPTGTANTNCLP